MTSEIQRSVREDLLHAAVGLLDDDGPDALQTRKVAGAAGTSTMAVYTHFGGMRGLIAEVAEEGLRQFDAAQTMPQTDRPGHRSVRHRRGLPPLRHRAAAYVSPDVRQHQRARHQRADWQCPDAHGRRDRAEPPELRACGAGGAPVHAGRPDHRRSRRRRRLRGRHRGPVLGVDTRVRHARAGRVLRRRRLCGRPGARLDDVESACRPG